MSHLLKKLLNHAAMINLIAIGLSLSCLASTCSAVFSSELTLNSAQRQKLRELSSSPIFKTRLLSTTINGKKRAVVLLGEKHKSSGAEAALTQAQTADIGDVFPHRGSEGVNPTRYWAPKLVDSFLRGMERGGKDLKLGPAMEAMLKPHLEQLEKMLIESLVTEVKTGKRSIEDLATLSIDNFNQRDLKALPDVVQMLIPRVDLAQVKTAVLSRLEETPSSQKRNTPSSRTTRENPLFELEKNHRPRILENIGALGKALSGKMVQFLMAKRVQIGSLALWVLGMTVDQTLLQGQYVQHLSHIAWIYAGAGAVSLGASLGFSHALFQPGRNVGMSSTVDQILRENPKINVLLVHVGKAHVDPMVKLFQKKNYSLIEVEDLD